ncbi:MAG TPA: alpha/beta fold hydrolase [Vicinamibacterales bacterium]|nr:alpha/beta fold hydrolase [Vicinamibacterales bacterium]
MRILSPAVALCVLMAAPELSAQGKPVNVDLVSEGATLKGTYFSAGKPGPGIVLFHQCSGGASRRLWDSLAGDLVTAGFHVMTFDNRGFGETRGALPPPPPPAGGAASADRWGVTPFPVADGLAALNYLKTQNGVDATRLAAGGSSCGVTDASNLAAASPDIRALLLLSGTPSLRGFTHIQQTPALAVLAVYAEQDMMGTPIAKVVPASKHPQSMTRAYPGAEHGVALLTAQPDLRVTIVKWLVSQVK